MTENIKRDKTTEEENNINNKSYDKDRLGYDIVDDANIYIIRSYYNKSCN